ncbi:NAD-dependent epimerase/dehydratase family protein [Mycolicibacterium mucogenicum]|uniref:NAD-dependent epimerase/dehydratase family protein n=1 Tax=Mycolicibacterium mucogenicum TaxID=56689 RepID=UPI000A4F5CB4|nr:NAD-dependent epimerase/dehydratase family protein [Mycolicibacterium mucogenicum]
MVGAGLLGSGIANRFIQQGDSVTALAPHPNLLLDHAVDFVHGRVELGFRLEELLDCVDVVVDAASSYVPATVQESPATALASSVGVSSWLAEQAVAAHVGCFIYLSSGGTVYGEGSAAHRESECPDPISSYGAMKVASEYAVAAITRGTATRTVSLRVANAYGPGQNLSRPQGIIGVAWRNHLGASPTTLYAAKSTVRDFVYVDDVGDLCISAAQSEFRGALNCGSGLPVTLNEVLGAMSDVAGAELLIEHQRARSFDVPRSVLDIGLARSLGWEPRVSLREGLERTWKWISTHPG